MIESIGKMLADVCKATLPFFLSEAQTKAYPYAVYEYTPQEFRTKDGVYKITADVYIRVYSEDVNDAETKAAALVSALDSFDGDATHNGGQYIIRCQATSETCVENVWQIELQYFVKQTR